MLNRYLLIIIHLLPGPFLKTNTFFDQLKGKAQLFCRKNWWGETCFSTHSIDPTLNLSRTKAAPLLTPNNLHNFVSQSQITILNHKSQSKNIAKFSWFVRLETLFMFLFNFPEVKSCFRPSKFLNLSAIFACF